MGEQTKYGYCVLAERWVPRDEMLSVNVKIYDRQGKETKIQIRVSEDQLDNLLPRFEELRWDNELMTKSQLESEGWDTSHLG